MAPEQGISKTNVTARGKLDMRPKIELHISYVIGPKGFPRMVKTKRPINRD